MNRPEAGATPADLAAALRALRAEAGNPSTRRIAEGVGDVSHTTVAEALSGRRVPSWHIVEGIAGFFGADAESLRDAWAAASGGTGLKSLTSDERDFVASYLARAESYFRDAPLAGSGSVATILADVGTLDDDPPAARRTLSPQEFEREVRRAVLVGSVGSGKTTLADAVALHCVERGTDLPFVVRLRDLAHNDDDPVVTAVERRATALFQRVPPPGLIEKVCRLGNALVVFDGLDEVDGESARRELLRIRFFAEEYPNVRVLVTCRRLDYDSMPFEDAGFEVYQLPPRDSYYGDAKVLEAELRRLALHDGLTGLANRTLFVDRVAQALARDTSTTLAVLYIDLDDFAVVNDGLGHVAGDALLCQVAERLRRSIGPRDTAARLGGDEFAILLVDVDGRDAATRMAHEVEYVLATPFVVDGRQLHITATIGLVLRPDEQVSTEVLLRRADIAMYLAKARGKNRVQTYETGMEELFRERLELKGDLAGALEQQQFRLVYQPILQLATGALVGFEALVRWQHPERGLVPPNVFVPIAEETGDIVALGQWVLETACEQLAMWQRRTFAGGLRMCVDVSIRQIEHPGLVASVREALSAAGLDPGDLTIEVTESALAADLDIVRGQLSELHRLGVKVAIDDFGTGYSSFGYLQQFPIDVLKIDRSFVMDLQSTDAEEADIVRAIVALAKSRGLRTVAEGIEEIEQADVLRELGCDDGQGYLYSRPLPPEEADEMVATASVVSDRAG